MARLQGYKVPGGRILRGRRFLNGRWSSEGDKGSQSQWRGKFSAFFLFLGDAVLSIGLFCCVQYVCGKWEEEEEEEEAAHSQRKWGSTGKGEKKQFESTLERRAFVAAGHNKEGLARLFCGVVEEEGGFSEAICGPEENPLSRERKRKRKRVKGRREIGVFWVRPKGFGGRKGEGGGDKTSYLFLLWAAEARRRSLGGWRKRKDSFSLKFANTCNLITFVL